MVCPVLNERIKAWIHASVRYALRNFFSQRKNAQIGGSLLLKGQRCLLFQNASTFFRSNRSPPFSDKKGRILDFYALTKEIMLNLERISLNSRILSPMV